VWFQILTWPNISQASFCVPDTFSWPFSGLPPPISPPFRFLSSGLFFGSTSNFTVVDTWRFWIIHLWEEGFFELFVTVPVAVTFYQLGVVRRINVVRVIYLDAILFLSGGINGTAHHWYWTGQANFISGGYSAGLGRARKWLLACP
jgi:hypothetical protein